MVLQLKGEMKANPICFSYRAQPKLIVPFKKYVKNELSEMTAWIQNTTYLCTYLSGHLSTVDCEVHSKKLAQTHQSQLNFKWLNLSGPNKNQQNAQLKIYS